MIYQKHVKNNPSVARTAEKRVWTDQVVVFLKIKAILSTELVEILYVLRIVPERLAKWSAEIAAVAKSYWNFLDEIAFVDGLLFKWDYTQWTKMYCRRISISKGRNGYI